MWGPHGVEELDAGGGQCEDVVEKAMRNNGWEEDIWIHAMQTKNWY